MKRVIQASFVLFAAASLASAVLASQLLPDEFLPQSFVDWLAGSPTYYEWKVTQ